MLLADIGNTRIHIYDGNNVIHFSHEDAIKQYAEKELKYIIVKHQLRQKLKSLKNWTDISCQIKIKNQYHTMGADRKALCLSHEHGIFVNAGTAISVDVVENGIYQGGFLLPGLKAYINSYANISSSLKIDLDRNINLDKLPIGTVEGISYGIICSLKTIIDKHKNGKLLYITGGDGKFLTSFFKGAIFDERLVFFGIKKKLNER
ncbi:Pantothenate kinase type III, CoaX-like [hydrothermal vent metagenome]|uniref:Type III pantothenate kinase n=1 Tax=hydrothermal vent metagenome TaxID=652676 RepID=A0A3B1E1V0_9ZZZZ